MKFLRINFAKSLHRAPEKWKISLCLVAGLHKRLEWTVRTLAGGTNREGLLPIIVRLINQPFYLLKVAWNCLRHRSLKLISIASGNHQPAQWKYARKCTGKNVHSGWLFFICEVRQPYAKASEIPTIPLLWSKCGLVRIERVFATACALLYVVRV